MRELNQSWKGWRACERLVSIKREFVLKILVNNFINPQISIPRLEERIVKTIF